MRKFAFALAMLTALPGASYADGKLAEMKQAGVARGQYLATIMDCGGCHTPGYLLGKPDMSRYVGGGDVGFQIPGAGIFYPPNLTPDTQTGLGRWSKADIVKAVTTGERPDGRMLAPIMPWHAYGKLTPKDAEALASYLKSLAPISNQVPPVTGPDAKPPGLFMTVAAPQ